MSSSRNRGRTPGIGGLGGLTTAPDELRQRRNERLARDAQTAAQIIPECDAVLGAGLGKPKEALPAIAPGVAASSSAALAAGHLAADVVLGALVCSGISGRSNTISNSA